MKAVMIKILDGILFAAAAVFVLCALFGCQTRITAQKFPETAVPFVVTDASGSATTNGYQVLSGGWYVTARSPLWADEAIKGLSVGTTDKGAVHLEIADYSRDLSTNAVVMVDVMFKGAAELTKQVGVAWASIASVGASSAVSSVANRAVAYFVGKGGDASKASVSCKDGSCTITDGAVSVSCDASGACTDN